jgi:hypothetical protein
MTMSGKCQDGDGDSVDGGASSLKTVGDIGRTIGRQGAAVRVAERTDYSGENDIVAFAVAADG